MGDRAQQRGAEPTRWNTDPTTDYLVGPDDAGNAAMHGIGLLVTGWRWIVGTLANRS